MKKVININFQGQVISIEETAYELLKQYIENLKSYFLREEDGDEIVNDIENRIAELFGNRLKLGISCITDEDVEAIITSIGRPEDFDSDYAGDSNSSERTQSHHTRNSTTPPSSAAGEQKQARPLNRNANDKIIAGVCSGLAYYFKIDPVWMRVIFVLLFSVLFWVYLVLWIVLKPVALESNYTKRLYRNPSDRWIGGVCGGIAAYFKIDSWIPRLIFAVPLLLNLVGMVSIPIFPWDRIFDNVDFNWNINFGLVVVYCVLWVIIPQATTVKQKLEMMGEDEYIQSIRQTVSGNLANVKSRANEPDNASAGQAGSHAQASATSAPQGEMPPEPPKNTYHSPVPASQRSGCLNALTVFLKIIFFAFAGIFALVILATLGALLFAGTNLLSLKSLFIDAGTENTLLWITGVLVIGIPVVAIILWIIRRILKAKSRPVIGIVFVVLWIAGMVTGGILGKNVAGKFSVEGSDRKSTSLTSFNGNTLYVDMAYYGNDYYLFSSGIGPGTERHELPYRSINEDSLLFSDISLKIIDTSDTLFQVSVITCANSRDLKTAKQNVRNFTYPIEQTDSVLQLPEFFSVPITQGFRRQNMLVEIAVPTGKKVEISRTLDPYMRNEPSSAIKKKYKKFSRTSGDGKSLSSDRIVYQEGTIHTETDTISKVL